MRKYMPIILALGMMLGAVSESMAQGYYQVFVRVPHRPTVTLDVVYGWSTENVKTQLSDLGYQTPNRLGVFFGSTQLQDGSTFIDYGIGSEAFLDAYEFQPPVTFTESQSWSPDTYQTFRISDFGNGGLSFSQYTVEGLLDFSGISAEHPLTLKIVAGTLNGLKTLENFNPSQSYSWTFADTQGITGFNSAGLVFDTSEFGQNEGGSFDLAQDGNQLKMTYNPTVVPEPSTAALAIAAMLGALVFRRRIFARV